MKLAKIKVVVDTTEGVNNLNKSNEAAKSLKQQLREATLEAQALASAEVVDQEALNAAIQKTADLKDRIADVNEQVAVFASGSKYEQVSNAFGQIGDAITSLDFGKAQERATAFATAARSITFKDAISSVKELGSSFLTIGKALLTNPLFLIGAVIAGLVIAIVKALDKLGVLKKITEAVGAAFGFLMDSITDVVAAITDFFGITSEAEREVTATLERSAKAAEIGAKKTKDANEEVIQTLDRKIAIAQAEGKSTVKLEREKLQAIIETAKAEYNAALQKFQLAVKKGEADAKEIADLKEKARIARLAYTDSKNDLIVFEAETLAEKKKANQKKQEEDDKAAKAANEKAAVARKEAIKAIRQIEQEYADSQLDDDERELAQLKRKYDELFATAKKYNIDTTKLTEAYLNQQNDIKVKYAQKEIDEQNQKNKELYDAQVKDNNDRIALEDAQFELLNELTLTEQEKEIQALIKANEKKFEIANGNDELEKALTEQQKKDIAAINDKYRNAELEKQKEANKALIDSLQETSESLTDVISAALTGSFDDINAAFERLNSALLDPENGLFAKLKNGSINAIEAVGMAIQTITSVISAAIEASQQRATEERMERYAAEEERYNAMLANQTLTREQFDIKMRELDQQKQQEELQARRKAFNQNKAIQIVNAVMQTAQAVLAAFSSAAAIPIAGVAMAPIMAGVAGALGAAQIGIISSQQFKAARGGIVPGAGPSHIDSVNAQLAPGEMVINANSAKMFGGLLSEINKAGGGISLAPEMPMESSMGKNVYQQNDEKIIKAYVSETDVTQVQKRISRIERTSSF